MKKFIIFIVALITLTWTVPVIAKDKRDRGPKRDHGRYEQKYDRNRSHGRHYRRDSRYKHRGHRYGHRNDYRHRHDRRHWKEREWRDHRRRYPERYRDGRYYKRDNQLYFEFETRDGRFVFSIGG